MSASSEPTNELTVEKLITDSERLDFAFGSRDALRYLVGKYDWDQSTPELRRAAIDLAMTNGAFRPEFARALADQPNASTVAPSTGRTEA